MKNFVNWAIIAYCHKLVHFLKYLKIKDHKTDLDKFYIFITQTIIFSMSLCI